MCCTTTSTRCCSAAGRHGRRLVAARWIAPIEIYLAGRATREYRGVQIPVDELVVGACRSWLAAHMHALDAERHVRVHCLVRPGSSDLVELFERQRGGAPRLANDTSMGVGYAPLTPLEGAVLAAERSLQRARSARASART